MSALGFLNFGNALTSAASKLQEQQKQSVTTSVSTTQKVNPYIAPAEQKQVVSGALSAAAQYQGQAEAAAGRSNEALKSVTKQVTEGKEAAGTAANQALAKAKLEYQMAVQTSQTNNKAVEQFQATYGSDAHKKQMQQLYEQQRANTQEVIAAQSQQDQGGFFNWIGSQFKAELAMEEAKVTDATINQLKANEMQATQQLAASFQANEMMTQNANAEELARTTMFEKQAATLVEKAKQNLGFDTEQFKAEMQVLGMNNEVVDAAMKRLQTLTATNDLMVSDIQAEQQRILKDTAALNLKEATGKYERSEAYRIQTEQDWKDHLTQSGVPEAEHRTFEQMVAEKDQTNVMNPLLINFMANRNSLGTFESKPASSSYAAYEAGEDSPVVRQTVKSVEELNARQLKKEYEEFEKTELKGKGYMTPEQQAKWDSIRAKYDLKTKDGRLNTARLAQLDRELKEATELTNKDVNAGNQLGLVELGAVKSSIKAQNLTQRLVAAGADPEVAQLVTSGEAEKILLDIRPKSDVMGEVASNIDAYLNTAVPQTLPIPEQIKKADVAARYMAQAYKLHRTSQSVKERFPLWRQTIISADTLRGRSSINLEDAGSISLLMRQAIIERQRQATNLNTLLAPGRQGQY